MTFFITPLFKRDAFIGCIAIGKNKLMINNNRIVSRAINDEFDSSNLSLIALETMRLLILILLD